VRPRFQADADLHFDIVTGVLRREPDIDFQSAPELLTEGMEDPEVLAARPPGKREFLFRMTSTRCQNNSGVSWPEGNILLACFWFVRVFL
jgi:hypothetical protein